MALSKNEIQGIIKQNKLRKDTYKLIENRDVIQKLAMKTGNILNRTTIIKILRVLKTEYGVPERTSISAFKRFTVDVLKLFDEVSILFEK
ncbi:MAG TPA: hypothetical protein VK982_04990, partial [Bacteroidales bacterium]|nr:hypothetical protein [Bacteroidales bacterium]